MPTVSFNNDERKSAKACKHVLFAFEVDGSAVGDFDHQYFKKGGPLAPHQAEELITAVTTTLKKFKSEAT